MQIFWLPSFLVKLKNLHCSDTLTTSEYNMILSTTITFMLHITTTITTTITDYYWQLPTTYYWWWSIWRPYSLHNWFRHWHLIAAKKVLCFFCIHPNLWKTLVMRIIVNIRLHCIYKCYSLKVWHHIGYFCP